MSPAFTSRQGDYLAFIWQYTILMNAAPSEGDVAEFFGVSGPSAHQMMVTLGKRGLLRRIPGVARSTRLTIPPTELPMIAGPGYAGDDLVGGLTAFAIFLARRLARRTTSLAALGATFWISERLAGLLVDLGSPPAAAHRARANFLRATGVSASLRRRPPASTAEPPVAAPKTRPETPQRTKARSEPPEGQGSLF